MYSSPRNLLFALAVLVSPSVFAAVDVKEEADKVRIDIGGKLFTEYLYKDSPHVFYWPLIGPGGVKMTRSFPMESPPNEQHDHHHHRSLWFAHGLVNGIDFWTESGPKAAKQTGKILHEKVVEAKGGEKAGVLTTAQKWVAPDGSIPLHSTQTLRVYDRPESERLFDFIITLTAADKDVVFGDTKEGMAGMRLAETMRLKQPNNKPGQGHIVNNNGDKDDAAWGKHAEWVDMYGPINDKIFGVAFFDHPTNLRHPTRWHARDYGLFAANPFCENEMDPSKAKGSGDYSLKAGQSLTFRYRIYIHEGEPNVAKLDEEMKAFAGEKE